MKAQQQYRRDAEGRIQRARAVCRSGTERKREENQRRHQRPRAEYERGDGKNRRSVLLTAGRTWLTILMVSALLIGTSGSILWWQGQQITDNYDPSPAGGRHGEDERENMGCELPERQQRPVPGAAEGRKPKQAGQWTAGSGTR